jgi:hypothetical protein
MGSITGTWRLNVKEIDRSSTVQGDALTTGAMVIRASRGPVKPVKIYKGEEKRILDIFGKPSSTYPDVWEAIQFCYQDDIWISAPYADDALLGGVLVTENGTEALSTGIDPDSLDDYSFSSDNEWFVLTSKSPSADWLGVTVERNTSNGFFTITLYETDDGGTTWTEIEDYEVSLVENETNGFGENIYITEVLEDNDYLQVVVNSDADLAPFTDDTSIVAFDKGDRGTTITITELNTGWDYFKSSSTYPAGIFMDPTSDSGIVTTFNTLRNTYQKYAFYIMPLPSTETASSAVTTKQGYGVNNAGLAFYWNYGKVKDTYNNSSFWTSLIGRVGVKLAQMADIYNGGAPAWIDENNHGGQLGPGILEMKYDPTESELQTLDEEGINPIVYYPGYGYMVVSQRTAQSPNNLSDTSWIAHRRLFDYIQSNIIQQVLVYQIVKLNDDYHRRLATSKGRLIVDPVLAEGLLADYAIVCNENNNDATARSQRKFIYDLFVKVTPYSETIEFRFTNVGQSVDIQELIAS